MTRCQTRHYRDKTFRIFQANIGKDVSRSCSKGLPGPTQGDEDEDGAESTSHDIEGLRAPQMWSQIVGPKSVALFLDGGLFLLCQSQELHQPTLKQT